MDLKKALQLLDLSENFSREEMIQSFRKKIFFIHPDTSGNIQADISVDDLLKSRKFLDEYLLLRSENAPGIKKEDDGYKDYREGMSILGAAMDSYWKKRVHYSQRPESADFIQQFHEELNRARDLFVRVLNSYPGGLWTPDAVEEIARINSWLGTEDGS